LKLFKRFIIPACHP